MKRRNFFSCAEFVCDRVKQRPVSELSWYDYITVSVYDRPMDQTHLINPEQAFDTHCRGAKSCDPRFVVASPCSVSLFVVLFFYHFSSLSPSLSFFCHTIWMMRGALWVFETYYTRCSILQYVFMRAVGVQHVYARSPRITKLHLNLCIPNGPVSCASSAIT